MRIFFIVIFIFLSATLYAQGLGFYHELRSVDVIEIQNVSQKRGVNKADSDFEQKASKFEEECRLTAELLYSDKVLRYKVVEVPTDNEHMVNFACDIEIYEVNSINQK